MKVRSDTQLVDARSRRARARVHARARPRWDAFCACAHTQAHTRTQCCVHTYAHTHVPSRARLVRALTTRQTTRRRIGAAA
jgi:hypothetical protein